MTLTDFFTDTAYIKPESFHGNKLPRYYGLSLRDKKVLYGRHITAPEIHFREMFPGKRGYFSGLI